MTYPFLTAHCIGQTIRDTPAFWGDDGAPVHRWLALPCGQAPQLAQVHLPSHYSHRHPLSSHGWAMVRPWPHDNVPLKDPRTLRKLSWASREVSQDALEMSTQAPWWEADWASRGPQIRESCPGEPRGICCLQPQVPGLRQGHRVARILPQVGALHWTSA